MSVFFSMLDQEKNKISKEAVCHTKKITQKHAQLTSRLHVCALFCSVEEISITQDLLTRCKKLQEFFHSSTTFYSYWRINKKKKILSNFLVLCEFLHVAINHIPLYLIKPPALQSSNASFSNRSRMLQWQAHTSINTLLHTLLYPSVSYRATYLAIFTCFFH
jgi:hypothetical protein